MEKIFRGCIELKVKYRKKNLSILYSLVYHPLQNNINLPSTIFLKAPLFNYVSFCKFPKAEIIVGMMKNLIQKIPNKNS